MDYFVNFDKMEYVSNPDKSSCLLCQVVKGEPQAIDLTVGQSEHFMACVNRFPYNPGHLMIFPKKHIEDIRKLDSTSVLDLHEFQAKVLAILDKLYRPTAFNIGYNMGLDAGASLTHLHLHIIPRYPHETGFADILSGKKILVENPFVTRDKLRIEFGE